MDLKTLRQKAHDFALDARNMARVICSPEFDHVDPKDEMLKDILGLLNSPIDLVMIKKLLKEATNQTETMRGLREEARGLGVKYYSRLSKDVLLMEIRAKKERALCQTKI